MRVFLSHTHAPPQVAKFVDPSVLSPLPYEGVPSERTRLQQKFEAGGYNVLVTSYEVRARKILVFETTGVPSRPVWGGRRLVRRRRSMTFRCKILVEIEICAVPKI